MTHFALYVLGPPRLERDGVPVHIPRRKVMALLIYLALNPARHSRDELATLLWPDQNQSSVRAGLRRSLSELRGILGAQAFAADSETGSTVQLVSPSADGFDLWVDAVEFRNGLQVIMAHAQLPDLPLTSYLVAISGAAQLYQADFLAGFTLEDSPGFEEWQVLLAESLKSELRDALEQLALGHLKRSEAGTALGHARRWIELDPENESAHRLLMRLYVAVGQRNAALAQYELCRRLLEQELDITPCEETQQLYERIRAGEVAEIFREARPHHLPVPLTHFIGREVEIAELCDLLTRQRLVTIAGPGGVGKTRLALRVGEGALEDFEDGVFFVDLSAIRDADLVISAIAAMFKLHESAERALVDVVTEYLAPKHLLLILDNFEQVVEAGPRISSLLETALHVHALVTSRAILRLSGEQVYHLLPLPLPQLRLPLSLAKMLKNEAIQLFLAHAQQVQSDFRLSQVNIAAIAEICRRLDGLPLGIELAAARIRLFSPPVMLSELDHQLKVLIGGGRDLPTRQQTMRASIVWSYSLLSAADQLLFRRLAVFVGGCTLEAAKTVCAEDGLDVAEGIESLLDKQLLQSAEIDGDTRYNMFETIREFALECLEQSGEGPVIHRQHADYYAAWQRRYLQNLNRLETELANLRAAMRWSIDSGQAELGLAIVNHIWFWTERNTEFRYWLDGLLSSSGAKVYSRVRMGVVFTATLQAAITQDDARCQALRDEHLALAIEQGDQADQFRNPYLTGYLLSGRGDYQGAVDAFAEGLAGSTKIGDHFMVAYYCDGLGTHLLLLQEYERAEASLHTSLDSFTEMGWTFGRIETLTALGYVALEREHLRQARTWLMQAIAEAQSVGFSSGLVDCLNGMGGLALQEGDPLRAARLYGAAEEMSISVGSLSHEPPLVTLNKQHLATLRLVLDPAALQKAWQEGRQMTMPEVLAHALTSTAQPRLS